LSFAAYKNYNHKQQIKLHQSLLNEQDKATKSVIEAEERERKRMATDLHDGLGQLLTAVKYNLSGLENKMSLQQEDKLCYEKVLSLIDESCKEVRNVSHNIMPNALIKLGLGDAVKDFKEKIENKKLRVTLDTHGLNDRIETNVEIVVYRIIQECVNNSIKHSKANKLDIALINDNEGLHITVEDNGIGFNKNAIEDYKGIGLRNIKTRVDYLKGELEIDTKLGKGTLVAITIPQNKHV
jgi:signal transduction histidine kinase